MQGWQNAFRSSTVERLWICMLTVYLYGRTLDGEQDSQRSKMDGTKSWQQDVQSMRNQ